MLALLIKEGSDSGNRTLRISCLVFTPIARAASIIPLGISKSEFSTSLAINGAAPTLNGTMAAYMPMDVPAIIRVNGIIQTIKMIKGIALKMLTTIDKDLYKAKFRSEEHTSELQSRFDVVCRLLLENK